MIRQEVGRCKDADLVVLDPAAPHMFSRGTLVHDRGKIKTEPGHGRFVARTLRRARQSVA